MTDKQGATDRRTRVVMVIDQLEAGGAQRQFCLLAAALHKLGFLVKILVLRRDSFFRDQLREAADVPVACLETRNRAHLAVRVRRAIRSERPDAVISFLSWPNLLVELAGLPRRSFAVIVSERNLDVSPRSLKSRLRYFFHRFADVVVSNSYAQRDCMSNLSSYLASRTTVIVNGVDSDRFAPRLRQEVPGEGIRILVLARFAPQKNVIRFIQAVNIVLSQNPDAHVTVDWYGKIPVRDGGSESGWALSASIRAAAYYQQVVAAIETYEIEGRFRLHGSVKDVERLYWQSDVVCLPSLHEGCSNVLAEAMACGVPVLASRISDNVRLVEDGVNGFLFDPMSAEDIADKVMRFSRLSRVERKRLGEEGRRLAQSMLSVDVFVDRYAGLIESLCQRSNRN